MANAFVQHDSEEERPSKRLRFSNNPNKGFKSALNEHPQAIDVEESEPTEGPKESGIESSPRDVDTRRDEPSSWPGVLIWLNKQHLTSLT